ncbi:MAG: diaminopimelate decarboxylase [Polyangiales bacterium]
MLDRDDRGVLRLAGVALDEALRRAGVATPAYVYDLDAIDGAARELARALGDRGIACYAIKANGSAPIVRTIVSAGCGIDVVSGGELALALACGTPAENIVYSGVAKRDEEIDFAVKHGIRAIHAESVEELERISARARGARVGIRVNPGVEADTHANIATGHDEAKFGIAREDLPRALDAVTRGGLRLVALSTHVGSMLMTLEPYVEGVHVIGKLAHTLRTQGFPLEYIDCGGGFGVAYRDDQHALPGTAFVEAARKTLDAAGLADLGIVIEPGRYLVAAHGVLVSRVIQPKRSIAGRRWLLVDAGMNDLIRPALYQAHHRIVPLQATSDPIVPWRVAGPVCESSDDFGEHPLPDPPPSMVVMREAGAYGRSMASQYNARPIASEVFLRGGDVVEVRRQASIEAFVRAETDPGVA